MTRYLRIAAAGFIALIALAFVGSWVRSWRWDEYCQGPLSQTAFVGVRSCYGVGIFQLTMTENMPAAWREWKFRSAALDLRDEGYTYQLIQKSLLGLGFSMDAKPGTGFGVMLPWWFLAASSLAVAALFALKHTWRFSIRVLLIATTLIAVTLGLGVYLL